MQVILIALNLIGLKEVSRNRIEVQEKDIGQGLRWSQKCYSSIS
jgi:hypothetical protein